MKTDTLSTEQTNTQLNSSNTNSLAWNVKPYPQGALASPLDTDIREAGWAKNKFRKMPDTPEKVVSISDFSAQTDFNNIAESVNDVIAIGQSGNPSDDLTLDNLKSAMGNLKRGKVYSFFGINGSGLTPFITSIAKGMCQSQESLVDQGVIRKHEVKSYAPDEVKNGEPSYYFYDRERETAKFVQDLFSYDSIGKDMKMFSHQDAAKKYSNLFHKTFGETHQKTWYHTWMSNHLDQLPNRKAGNLDVIFFNGVQNFEQLEVLKQLAYQYDCVVITTSVLQSGSKTIPETALDICDFAATLKKKTDSENKQEPEGTHRLYIVKNNFLKNKNYQGQVKFQAVTASGKNGPKIHKKTNYLLFDMKKNITWVKDRGFFSDILEKYEELGDIKVVK